MDLSQLVEQEPGTVRMLIARMCSGECFAHGMSHLGEFISAHRW